MEGPPFKWEEVSVESIKKNSEMIISQTRELCERIASLPDDQLSFETVISPLMSPPNYKTNPRLCETKFLQHCSTNPDIRKAAKEAGIAFAKERISQRMHEGVYQKVKKYSESEEVKTLDEYQRYFVNSIISDFERSGLGLDNDDREKLVKLLQKDAELCASYSANLSNEDTTLIFTKDELNGVNDEFIKSHINSDGNIEIGLKYPDIIPILRNCNISSTREKVVRIRGTVYGNNLELMAEGIQLRKSIANLLNYNHYADYITAERMTGNAKTVIDFLSSLRDKVKDAGEKELEKLLLIKKNHVESRGEEFDGKINAWDFSYYHELLMKTEYGVDDDVIREYFPVHVIVEETMNIYQNLLSLRFEEIYEFQRWHSDVRLFAVYNNTDSNDSLIGHFYLDLHPRDGKYTHAAIFHLLKKHDNQVPTDCMLTNLPAPLGDQPALLTHDDVVTFFHEFGHIMHALCGEGEANNTHLAKCPRDFVEAPSQMLENWCWKSEVLSKLSKHYKTGETLPKELLDKLIAAKNVNVALSTLRQVLLATLDITIHTNPPGNAQELQELYDRLKPEISLIENPENCNILRSFGHLMNQYAAAYYGYLWSEVLSADMFHTRFEKEGIFNSNTGMDYRKIILAPGGVGSIMEHVTKFLGRPPKQDHFLQSRGLQIE